MSPDQEKEGQKGTIDVSGPVHHSNTEKDTHIDIKKLNKLIGLTRILVILCIIWIVIKLIMH
jgi:hypothetical protein